MMISLGFHLFRIWYISNLYVIGTDFSHCSSYLMESHLVQNLWLISDMTKRRPLGATYSLTLFVYIQEVLPIHVGKHDSRVA